MELPSELDVTAVLKRTRRITDGDARQLRFYNNEEAIVVFFELNEADKVLFTRYVLPGFSYSELLNFMMLLAGYGEAQSALVFQYLKLLIEQAKQQTY